MRDDPRAERPDERPAEREDDLFSASCLRLEVFAATVLPEPLPVELRTAFADLLDADFFADDVERLLLAVAMSGKIVTKDVRRTRTTEVVPARANLLIINPFLLHATSRGPGGKSSSGLTAADKKGGDAGII
jgi:hypothetical protein